MGLLLWIVSLVLSIILLPLGIIYGLIKAVYKNRFFIEGLPNINQKFMKLATGLDIFGNVACKEIFNSTLIKKSSTHGFGNYGETISSVIGHNKLNNTLTGTGKILDKVLDLIDKNHSLKAIKSENT